MFASTQLGRSRRTVRVLAIAGVLVSMGLAPGAASAGSSGEAMNEECAPAPGAAASIADVREGRVVLTSYRGEDLAADEARPEAVKEEHAVRVMSPDDPEFERIHQGG